MGKKSTPKAPAAPDYAAAATAQGQANIDASRTGAELTNTNQYTPYGSQVFTKNPGSDQWSSTINLAPEQQRLLDLQNQGDQALGEAAVSQLGRVKDSFSQPLDTSGAPDRVTSVGGSNYSMYGGDPAAMQRVGQAGAMQRVGQAGQMGQVGDAAAMGQVGDAEKMQRLMSSPEYAKYTADIANLPDYGTQAKEVEDALYRQSTSRLDPEYAQRESAERQRLINAGVAEDSEMFSNSMNRFNQQRQADYGDARDRSIAARGAEQSRLNNDFYTGNAQKFGQEMTKLGYNNDQSARGFADQQTMAGFNNTAAQTDYSNSLAKQGFNNSAATQDVTNRLATTGFNNNAVNSNYANELAGANFNNAAGQQDYANQVTGAGFNNSASQQDFSNQMQKLGFNNTAEQQRYADAITGGNFQNQQRGAAIDEAAYLRNEPLNAYNALSTGAQVTNPQFRGTGQVATPGAAPTFAATQAADQRAIDLYNAKVASSGSAAGGLFGMMGQLGGSYLSNPNTKFSDRRLKQDIVRIGHLSDSELPVYSYTIGGEREAGVMADEALHVHPDAVSIHDSGYYQVDYSKLKGHLVLEASI